MDRILLSKSIDAVFNEVIDTVGDTPETSFNEIPFEGSWTIGQVAEHMVLCSRGIPDSRVENSERNYDEQVADLETIFLNMSQKSQAAEAVTPRLPPHNKAALLEKLKANRALLEQTLAGKDLTQLCLDMEFPYMGYLTRYEWLFFIKVHTQRHLNQMKHIQEYLKDKP